MKFKITSIAIGLILWLTGEVFAFSIFAWRDTLYQNVKEQAEKSFSDLFQKKVTIKKASGIILGQIILEEVLIPEIGNSKKLILNFNPFKYIYHKGDIVPALTKIIVEHGDFKIIRNEKGHWNILTLRAEKNAPSPSLPTFRGRILLKMCRLHYFDALGFRPQPSSFLAEATEVNGAFDLRKKELIKFSLSGKIPEFFKLNGWYHLKTGKYEAQLKANQLSLSKWGNYALPFSDLIFTQGTANLFLQVSPPKTKGWPVALIGRATLKEASGIFQTYPFSKASGDIFLADENISFPNFQVAIHQIPFLLSGRIYDFSKLNLDLKLSVAEGEIFQQKFKAEAEFRKRGHLLGGQFKLANLWQGNASGTLSLDLSQKFPILQLQSQFSKIDLAALAQNAPGIEGEMKGNLLLTGPLNHLRGQIQTHLSQTLVFGQPLQEMKAAFRWEEQDLILENFSAASGKVSFSSQGKIGADFAFDLQAQASGFQLSGKNVLGEMKVLVDQFQGSLKGKLDQAFLSSPLRHLRAEGKAILRNGKIGLQTFDLAEGKVKIGEGKIQIEEAYFRKENSTLLAQGQTGLGIPTRLTISGKNLELENFKILNYFLPSEAQNPKGRASLEVEITGIIPAETKLTSLDPLFDLNLYGKAKIEKGEIAGILVSNLDVGFAWKNHNLLISPCQLKLPEGSLALDLFLSQEGDLRGSLEGTTDLLYLHKALEKYGRMEGKIGLKALLSGKIGSPVLQASFWILPFRFQEISFEELSGSINLENQRLTFLSPLKIYHQNGLYLLSGKIDFSPKISTDLKLEIINADFSSTYHLTQAIWGKISQTIASAPESKPAVIHPLYFPPEKEKAWKEATSLKLYSANGEKNCFLKMWHAFQTQFEESLKVAPEENLGGLLAGTFEVKGEITNPSGNFSLSLNHGFFGNFSFDKVLVEASFKNQELKVEKARLVKQEGILSAQGSYHFGKDLFLYFTASNLPLEILQAIFPQKEFKGSFSMNADLHGPLSNPILSLSAAGKNLVLAGIKYDQVSLSLVKKNDYLYLYDFSLLEQNQPSGLSGTIPLSPSGKINLEVNLKDNAWGLLNLLTDEICWRAGKAFLSAKISGSLENLEASGEAQISDASLYVRALDSEIQKIEGQASFKKGLLEIKFLKGLWSGNTTSGWNNSLGLAGTINFSQLLSAKSEIWLNLSFSPSSLMLAFPNLYAGELNIKELTLTGPFSPTLKEGPLLKGKIDSENALITISQGLPSEKIIPLNFDLGMTLGKNTYAVMGNVITLNLSNVFMNLEVAAENLKISGSLQTPSLLGKVAIKRGSLNILNREFSLLPPEKQERFFPYDPAKIEENYVLFNGEEGLFPEINLTSSVNIEEKEKQPSGEYLTQQVTVLAKLKGVIGAKEEERGLKISLLGFTEDKTKSPPELIPAAYSEQELKVMLLPDFIKSLAGIGREPKGTEEKVDPNLVLADYLNSRVQTLLFRTLEREAEKALGLESLTLEYNFGPKIREALGVKETPSFEEEKPAWSVGFIKGITDRLYIDVRYAQAMEETPGVPGQTTFNYQLTYKITPIWSIIYYREPISLAEPTTGYQKITLKAGFSFW